MQYEQILLETNINHSDEVALWLTEQELSFQQMDASTLEAPPVGKIHFRIFVTPEESNDVLSQVKKELVLPDLTITHQRRDEAEWQDTWKKFFAIRNIGQFVIIPSWEEKTYQLKIGEIPLFLDPGRAFGTGGHASTRLCLRLLSQLNLPLSCVLDVGCGSGILMIAALKKYPKALGWGIDIEEEAIEVTKENALRNEVISQIDVSTMPLDRVEKTFDVVFANLTSPVILQLAGSLAHVLAKHGVLFVSGITQDEVTTVQIALEKQGLVVQHTETEEDWVGLLVKKKGP